MTRYTDKKAARYCNRVLTGVEPERARALENAWSDTFGRWFVCDAYRAYRLESEPDGLRVVIRAERPNAAQRAEVERVHIAVESMFDAERIGPTVEIPVDYDAVVAASRDRGADYTIDLGEDFPVVNARYLRDALEMLPGGRVYCQDNARRMISPVYVMSADGIALILPVRRENKLHWVYSRRSA